MTSFKKIQIDNEERGSHKNTINENKTFTNVLIFVVLNRPPERSPKIAKPTVFHVVIAGYWGKFSISNNRASVGPHWLRYCHCAKLIW